MIAQQLHDQLCIPDIADNEFGMGRAFKRSAVTGIGQRIKHDHPVFRMMRIPIVDEIAANETSAARDEQASQASFPLAA